MIDAFKVYFCRPEINENFSQVNWHDGMLSRQKLIILILFVSIMYTLAGYHINDCKLDEKVSQSRLFIFDIVL